MKTREEIEELKKDAYIRMKPTADKAGLTEEELKAFIDVTVIKMINNNEL